MNHPRRKSTKITFQLETLDERIAPAHLGLGAVTQPQPVVLLELVVDAAQIAAAVGAEIDRKNCRRWIA